MNKLDPETRKRLEQQDTLDAFCRERTKLILQGMDSAEAHRMALNKWDKPNPGDPSLPPVGQSDRTMTQREHGRALFKAQMSEERRIPGSVFEDKKCSFEEMVEWVGHQLDIKDVEPTNAPSSVAWSLLMLARSSWTHRRDFFKDFYAKIHTLQTSDDQDVPFKDDGREIIDTIETLRAAGQ